MTTKYFKDNQYFNYNINFKNVKIQIFVYNSKQILEKIITNSNLRKIKIVFSQYYFKFNCVKLIAKLINVKKIFNYVLLVNFKV